MSDCQYRRTYRGPIRAAIFDWAGTTVDYGCCAPAMVFVEVFRREGVEITPDEARGPMGRHKRDHLRELTRMPEIARRWQATHGRAADEQDIDRMFATFIPLQIACLGDFADPIPGCVETIAELRSRGVKIGSDTGYDRQMMDVLAPAARRRGFAPDCMVCSSDVPIGRPAPWLAFENARRLDVYPPAAVVKIDDTVPGVEEGLNAGMWTIAVAVTGNEVGLSLAEIAALDGGEFERRRAAASRRLAQSGAHYVVDGMADLLPCIDDLERRLQRGESP